MKPAYSVVIPVYNEETIVESAVRNLVSVLERRDESFEIILSENGSRDATLSLCRELHAHDPRIQFLSLPKPNYGGALRSGILHAHGEIVFCDEIDLCMPEFYEAALPKLRAGADLVVGSKRHRDSRDNRPFPRRLATKVVNQLLWMATQYPGTDTHGPKAFWRKTLLPCVHRCQVEYDLFASELVVRAARENLNVQEVPLNLREIRPPSIALYRRVPRVLGQLVRLGYVVRKN